MGSYFKGYKTSYKGNPLPTEKGLKVIMEAIKINDIDIYSDDFSLLPITEHIVKSMKSTLRDNARVNYTVSVMNGVKFIKDKKLI